MNLPDCQTQTAAWIVVNGPTLALYMLSSKRSGRQLLPRFPPSNVIIHRRGEIDDSLFSNGSYGTCESHNVGCPSPSEHPRRLGKSTEVICHTCISSESDIPRYLPGSRARIQDFTVGQANESLHTSSRSTKYFWKRGPLSPGLSPPSLATSVTADPSGMHCVFRARVVLDC
ncbi:hypothetical protein BT67DRAFT_149159 [Trichocladium antarcticum]|uniref:Uncharacterized protein n=1 Tax=Trichocladium antarcticum TaxID=1450529 RepID=A0AAN6UFF3_9PEZI|nr:hypothetical protein BT67DRAFT_149159 [Trichocladium antarcticum]